MKRLVLAASLLALVGGGCDDDSTLPRNDAGMDGPGADADEVGAMMCKGAFDKVDRIQLPAKPGACTMVTTDLDYICANDIAARARNCGVSCLQSSRDPASCVSICIQQNHTVTAACADCYKDLFACTASLCSTCLASPDSPTSPACLACQETNCSAALFACTGLRGGTAPPADAAGVDVPGVDAGKADGAVDAPKADAAADAADASADTGSLDAGADADVDAGADAADAG